MQVVNNFRPVTSPCHDCVGIRAPEYPDCNSFCLYVNQYLIALGDKPLPAYDRTPLYVLFPPSKASGNKTALATGEQTEEARQKIAGLLKTGIKPHVLGKLIGLSHGYINNLLGISKRMKRIGINKYKLIMEYKHETMP